MFGCNIFNFRETSAPHAVFLITNKKTGKSIHSQTTTYPLKFKRSVNLCLRHIKDKPRRGERFLHKELR
jgi:hypothetical protein